MKAKLDADLEATLFPELRQITNMTDASTSDMHNVCNYIHWAKENSLDLAFTLTPEQSSQCEVSYERNGYEKFVATDDLVYQFAYEYLQILHELSQVVDGSLAFDAADTFRRYYNMTRSSKQRGTEKMPKFVLYSGHTETVAPILGALGSPLRFYPEPATMVFVLYHEDLDAEPSSDERFRVSVWHANHWRTEHDATLLYQMTGVEFQTYI